MKKWKTQYLTIKSNGKFVRKQNQWETMHIKVAFSTLENQDIGFNFVQKLTDLKERCFSVWEFWKVSTMNF